MAKKIDVKKPTAEAVTRVNTAQNGIFSKSARNTGLDFAKVKQADRYNSDNMNIKQALNSANLRGDVADAVTPHSAHMAALATVIAERQVASRSLGK